MRKMISFALCFLLPLLLVACETKINDVMPNDSNKYIINYADLLIADSDKQEWYEPLVKLISNQEKSYGNPADGIIGYMPPRPDEPSIAEGYRMGLFDVNIDGTPELLVDLGGGSAGNSYYYIYDIISGEHIGTINGGGIDGWCMYYNTTEEQFVPIGRCSWRSGDACDMHFTTAIGFSGETEMLEEKPLFYLEYEYDKTKIQGESGQEAGYDMQIAEVIFAVNGSQCNHDEYYSAYDEFLMANILIPDTGLKLYRWSDVSKEGDSLEEKAAKMAETLLYCSGQKFVKAVVDK